MEGFKPAYPCTGFELPMQVAELPPLADATAALKDSKQIANQQDHQDCAKPDTAAAAVAPSAVTVVAAAAAEYQYQNHNQNDNSHRVAPLQPILDAEVSRSAGETAL
jgi:hypothetical protein